MDRIRESLKKKRFVFWEEIARDGAQAKTILTGKQRAEIANYQSKIFGENAPDHLVFAAGFVSIAPQEVEAIKVVADEVDNCYLAVNCRSVKNEIIDSLDSLKNAKYPRVAFVLPTIERMCRLMLHKPVIEVLEYGLELAKYALDISNGVPIDVQLALAYEADPNLIAEYASKFTELGIATVGLGDSMGKIYPNEIKEYNRVLLKNSSSDCAFAPHLHNDLGLAVENTIQGVKQGITFACSSWLGLAERNGLGRTELLTFLLSYEKEKLKQRFGFDGENLFLSEPNLKLLNPIAKLVSEYTGHALSLTDPIVGTGLNSISTGTPFIDTISFQPFDPKKVLNVDKEVFVTQLANRRVIIEVGKQYGYTFSKENIYEILSIIKERAYRIDRAIIPKNELIELFEKYGEKIN